eukprot:scaffold158_cov388-Prasinococcus_capsulatus_cf.AAC.13
MSTLAWVYLPVACCSWPALLLVPRRQSRFVADTRSLVLVWDMMLVVPAVQGCQVTGRAVGLRNSRTPVQLSSAARTLAPRRRHHGAGSSWTATPSRRGNASTE